MPESLNGETIDRPSFAFTERFPAQLSLADLERIVNRIPVGGGLTMISRWQAQAHRAVADDAGEAGQVIDAIASMVRTDDTSLSLASIRAEVRRQGGTTDDAALGIAALKARRLISVPPNGGVWIRDAVSGQVLERAWREHSPNAGHPVVKVSV